MDKKILKLYWSFWRLSCKKIIRFSDGNGQTYFRFSYIYALLLIPSWLTFSSKVVITTKPGTMLDQNALTYIEGDDDATTTRSYDYCLWFSLHSYEPYNSQIWQNG